MDITLVKKQYQVRKINADVVATKDIITLNSRNVDFCEWAC